MLNKQDCWMHNDKIFNTIENISTADVLLQPSSGILSSRSQAVLDEPFIFSSPMDTVTGIDLTKKMLENNQAPIFCRFLEDDLLLVALNKFSQFENFWFSVGANDSHFSFLEEWAQANPTQKLNICIDVAHGDMKHLYKLYKKYSTASWCRHLMSGTIASVESAQNMVDVGCTHLRVGIGPGSACSTRIVTGCGIPNLTAIYNIWNYFQQSDTKSTPKIIADGGIKSSGDIVKYLAAGADAVVVGNLLSKTLESHGWKTNYFNLFFNILTFKTLFNDCIFYKRYRGQASKEFQLQRIGTDPIHTEGVQGAIQHPEYTTDAFVLHMKASVSSALSYLGLSNLKQLKPTNVKFLRISNNALKESVPHLLYK